MKQCPVCSISFTSRYTFCSRSCAGKSKSNTYNAKQTSVKQCKRCGDIKAIEDFYLYNRGRAGASQTLRRPECKKCHCERTSKRYPTWKSSDPIARKRRSLKNTHNLTLEEYEDMKAAQSGRCAICGIEQDVLCVDHDHRNGKIRSLLCHVCNRGIGHFKDDPHLVRKAAAYLESFL